MSEIDRVSAKYYKRINEIRNCSASREELEDFLRLRESILKRIEEIDQFYEDNFSEEGIQFFEQARLKLRKLLAYDLSPILNVPVEQINFEPIDNNFLQKRLSDEEYSYKIKLEKEEKKDLTRKRISVLISSDPQEEKKIRFDDRRRTTMLGLDERRQTNLIKIAENTIESEDVAENNCKMLPTIKEKPKRLKTILIHNEEFRNYLESTLNIRGNINIEIKLNEEEMKSLLQAKSLLLK